MRKPIRYISISKPVFKMLEYTGRNGLYSSVKPDQNSVRYLMDLVKALGFDDVDADTLHCTIMYSKDSCPHETPGCDSSKEYKATVVKIQYWTGHDEKGYITAALKCPALHREHRRLKELGCTPTFDYNPHITLYSGVSEDEFERRVKDVQKMCGKEITLVNQTIGDLKDPVVETSTSSLNEGHVKDLRGILERMQTLTAHAERIIKVSGDVFPASRAFWLRDLKRALGLIPAANGSSLMDTIEYCERLVSSSSSIGDSELKPLEAGIPVPLMAVRLRQAYLERSIKDKAARLKNAARQSDADALKELNEHFDEVENQIEHLRRIRKIADRPLYDEYITNFVSRT